MDELEIYERDRVGYKNSLSGDVECGIVEKIDENYMFIKLDGYNGKVTMSAQKKDGKWFAFNNYHGCRGYVEEVFKI